VNALAHAPLCVLWPVGASSDTPPAPLGVQGVRVVNVEIGGVCVLVVEVGMVAEVQSDAVAIGEPVAVAIRRGPHHESQGFGVPQTLMQVPHREDRAELDKSMRIGHASVSSSGCVKTS